MTGLQKGTLWAVGCIGWVFVLSIALSRITFGYFDWRTIGIMGVMLVPVLSVAAVLMVWKNEPRPEEPSLDRVPRRATRVVSERGVQG